MGELQHLGEYVKVMRQRLPKKYFKPVPHRALWMLPYLVLITAAIWMLATLHLHWLPALAISAVIGMSYASLGFLGHEILHGSVFKTPWLRNVLGGLCFAPFNLGPKLWRRWHNVEHHGHTQHDEDDPDTMHTLEDMRERPGLQVIYRLAPWLRSFLTFAAFTFWFSVHGFGMMWRYSKETQGRERLMYRLQFVLPLVFWLSLWYFLGFQVFLFAYLLPLMVANFMVMSYISTNHLLNPLTETNDPLANSLTVNVPRWVDVLHHNFSHHTEHHIFPAMNSMYAPRVRELAKEMYPDRYNEMPHWKALLTLWRTPRLYRSDTSLIDPHRQLVYPTLGHGLDPDDLKVESLRQAERGGETHEAGGR